MDWNIVFLFIVGYVFEINNGDCQAINYKERLDQLQDTLKERLSQIWIGDCKMDNKLYALIEGYFFGMHFNVATAELMWGN